MHWNDPNEADYLLSTQLKDKLLQIMKIINQERLHRRPQIFFSRFLN